MTDAELRKSAASQIDQEIGQSVAPIQSQIGIVQGQESRALSQVGGMFDALQPVVQQSATAVQASYDQAMAQEHSIFAEAQGQLQTLRGNRAADAQSMAQKTGGPVAIDEWTQPFDNAATDLTYLGAGQQLHTLAYAQAGEQVAQQFAGQIFPLVRTEQMATVRSKFQDQIKDYQDQIVALKSQKGAQVNKRYTELRTQELQYGLDRAQYQLSKLDDQRNYNLEVKKAKAAKADNAVKNKLAQQQYNLDHVTANRKYKLDVRSSGQTDRQLGQTDRQLDQADKDFSLRMRQTVDAEDERTGTQQGKKTLAALERDDQVNQAAAQLDLSKKELAEKKAEFARNAVLQAKSLKVNQSSEWTSLMDNAVNPQPGKTYTTTEKQEVSATTALTDTSGNVYVEYIKGVAHYFKNVETTTTVPNNFQPINDPNRLTDYLVTGMNDPKNFSRARAEELVKSRFPELKDWHYGDPWPPPHKKLAATKDDPFALGKIITAGNKKSKQRFGQPDPTYGQGK